MSDDFERFWVLYPRKIAKAYARKIFARLTTDQQFAAIESLPVHVRYWQQSGRSWDYLPHASTWLAGECWADELQMPNSIDSDWHKSQEGIQKKAIELGMWPPKLGEGWHELKARILARTRAA